MSKVPCGAHSIPQIGLGTWKAEIGVAKAAVKSAIKHGYRHLDCAADYGNEKEVGEGIREAIAEGICTREDLWITSKLWCTNHGKYVRGAFNRTLSDLGLEYLDLYLVHFPIALKHVPEEERYPSNWTAEFGVTPFEFVDTPISETWAEMEKLKDAGLVREIGVSNFCAALLMDLLKTCKHKPAANQIELHPYLTQEALVKYCQANNIHVTAYSPLGSTSYIPLGADQGHGVGVLANPTILALAEKYGRTPAQILLRWLFQRGVSSVPKSSQEARLIENLDIESFSLSEEDTAKIFALNSHTRYNDPALYLNYPIFS